MYSPSSREGPLCQGEILSDINQLRLELNSPDPYRDPVIDFATHPYAIIVTQDCDLDLDHKARQGQTPPDSKTIDNVLLCEAVIADHLRARPGINQKLWDFINSNQHQRYHLLQMVNPEQDLCREGIPGLGIDFKRYFTIPTAELYFCIINDKIRRRCKLDGPYLQDIIMRFHYYQSRVPLPD